MQCCHAIAIDLCHVSPAADKHRAYVNISGKEEWGLTFSIAGIE
jgi:hypothetical protein